ncbi:hypothetical protein DB346_24670 [Verrucomicrobia bacterium LW23]|nr:hypothetical protein DB346_24670 [Verrucomicrobia bacterium LW23]
MITSEPAVSGRMLFRRIATAALLVCTSALLCATAASAQGTRNEWDPKSTWIFAAGIIQYDDKSITSWPDHSRVDDKMIQAYRNRGVPDEQILYIKNKDGTREELEEQLAEFAAKAGKGDTFIFYYSGHGSRDYKQPTRPVSLMTYDTEEDWRMASVVKSIVKNFPGNRVLLTADCCYSGALQEEVYRNAGRIPMAVLTSSKASSTSTGNWTFTQVLTDAINGSPLLDLNGDGDITLQEVATYADDEMSFMEGQRTTYLPRPGTFFSPGLVIAKATGKKAPRAGERLEGEDQGKWYKVKILDSKDDKFLVTWVGWAKSYDSWLSADKLRPYDTTLPMKNGTAVEIEWRKKWWPGTVVKSERGLYMVRYTGYNDIDNEWVVPKRVRAPQAN